ncbi:MAG: metallophosphoesterase [Oscillospiraceae bacterium]|nr:metallophosphoesterase [Oscillospiraceae bacterium]
MLYVTGDTHGDLSRFSDPRLRKLKKGDTLIICGDFGFVWDGTPEEEKRLKKLGNKRYNICFLDGTHENFDLLKQYKTSEWNGGKVQRISGNLYHLCRGQLYEIDGLKVFAMGGGESPDFDIRMESETWSRAEIPTKKELLDAASVVDRSGGKIDIIVTHEPPLKLKGFLLLKENKETLRVTGLNTFFEEMSSFCKFRRWFFGSLHEDKFISSCHVAVFQNIVCAHTGEPLR